MQLDAASKQLEDLLAEKEQQQQQKQLGAATELAEVTSGLEAAQVREFAVFA
jgi:hypothetical protein